VELGKQLCEYDSFQNKIQLPWNNSSKNPKNFSSVRREQRNVSSEYEKAAYFLYPNALIDDLKKFPLRNGKNGRIFI